MILQYLSIHEGLRWVKRSSVVNEKIRVIGKEELQIWVKYEIDQGVDFEGFEGFIKVSFVEYVYASLGSYHQTVPHLFYLGYDVVGFKLADLAHVLHTVALHFILVDQVVVVGICEDIVHRLDRLSSQVIQIHLFQVLLFLVQDVGIVAEKDIPWRVRE